MLPHRRVPSGKFSLHRQWWEAVDISVHLGGASPVGVLEDYGVVFQS